MAVPNIMPVIDAPYKLAIIGTVPSRDDEFAGKPFSGTPGRFLDALLSRAGVSRDACFVGNICQLRPINNDVSTLAWSGPEIQDGLNQLTIQLRAFQPNACLLLGRLPLKAAKDLSDHPLIGKHWRFSLDDWRGSVFKPTDIGSPMFGYKCIASYHPADCFRQYAWTPLLQFDIRRAMANAKSPDLHLPVRNIAINLTADEIIDRLNALLLSEATVGADIEGYWNGLTCIAFATSPSDAFVIPFVHKDGTHYFSLEDEMRVWKKLSEVLISPKVKKVWQNGLYDRFCLQYGHACPVFGNKDDIMVKHWEQYCELEKSLAMQTSLYTDQPFYKGDRKTNDDTTYWRYNGMDSCVTTEINSRLEPMLQPRSKEHYHLNHEVLDPLLYMEIRGMRYDSEGAKRRRDSLVAAIYAEQFKLDILAGAGCPATPQLALAQLREQACYKKSYVASWNDLPGTLKKVKKQGIEDWYNHHLPRIMELGKAWETRPLTASERGEMSTLCYFHMNVDSNKQFQEYVYGKLALPLQTKTDTDGIEKPTTDYEALLNLSKKTKHPAITHAIELRSMGTRAGMLSIHADPDGRIRCGYNVVGTETGRLACYTSPTGSGYNLQTIPNYTNIEEAPGGVLGDRDLFLADEGHWFFQCDLAGADGWTVAAHLRALGHPVMYDDYIFGLKPAKILCLMLRHGESVNSKSREELKAMSASVEKDSWEYFACKQGQHGTCYLMGAVRLAKRILIESEGKVHMSATETKAIQALFERRYRVSLWHSWMARQLAQSPSITSASGHRRIFFGRKDEILAEALAHEPQSNTTYATNRAVLNLWKDPENRDASGRLRIEPLHQVHDALCGQFRKEDTEWAKVKIRQWFNNPLTIAGQQIIIPFEGGYGKSWGELKEGTI
jgi:uracil-DNA glycosylase family 4